VIARVDWPIPGPPGVLAQGKIAGVPSKLLITDDAALLVTQAAYARDLADRLGWLS
jgi:hypothetical protein